MDDFYWLTPPKANSDSIFLDGKVDIRVIIPESKGDVVCFMESYFFVTKNVELVEAIVIFNGVF